MIPKKFWQTIQSLRCLVALKFKPLFKTRKNLKKNWGGFALCLFYTNNIANIYQYTEDILAFLFFIFIKTYEKLKITLWNIKKISQHFFGTCKFCPNLDMLAIIAGSNFTNACLSTIFFQIGFITGSGTKKYKK